MRDLRKIEDFPMDYIPEFDGIKSILEYCDRNVKPFKKLAFRSDKRIHHNFKDMIVKWVETERKRNDRAKGDCESNDSIINDLVRRLQDYFDEMQLINTDTKTPLPGSLQTLRKILVFLLANTDATYKYNMKDDNHLAHIFEICPLIPKFLTVTLVWELQMDQLFYEALAYTPCWFAFQFFEAASESLKYIDDAKKVLKTLEEIFKSLLINIERSSFLQMDIIDQKIIFNKMYDQAIILLRRFNTPDASKLARMKKRELKNYWGFCLQHLLQMVLFSLDLYELKANTEPQLDISVYKIGATFQKNQWTKKQLTEAIRGEELKIINALLGTLQNCVMAINMDYFLEWVEVDLTPSQTLQQAIGEMAYKVRQRLAENAAFEHGVADVLKTIEIRPRSLEQIVSDAKIGDILRALDDATTMTYSETKMWYDELFKRGTAVLGNSECLEYIMDHLKLTTKENCVQVMDCIHLKKACDMNLDDVGSDDEDTEINELKILLQTAAEQLNSYDLLEVIEYRYSLFGEDAKALTIDSQQLEERITEFLNKCTFDLNKYLVLCLQDPLQLWSKFFISACHVNDHVHNFLDTVIKTLPASSVFVDKALKNAVQDRTNAVYFPKLFTELYFLIYKADKTDFLAKFLNGHIKKLSAEEDFESLSPIIKALVLITAYDEKLHFEELTAPMLALVCNLAERWTPNTYNSARVYVITEAIDFIRETLNRFLPVISEKDRKWLTAKLKTSDPLTQYYFQGLLKAGERSLTLDKWLLPDEGQLNDAAAVVFLNKTILRCNAAESCELFSNKRLQLQVPNALLQIARDINNDECNEKAALNFQFCLSNYLNFVNSLLDDNSKNWTLLKSILEIIAAAPKEQYERIFMEAECLLQQLLRTCTAQPDARSDSEALEELKRFVEFEMPDCPAKYVFLKSSELEFKNE